MAEEVDMKGLFKKIIAAALAAAAAAALCACFDDDKPSTEAGASGAGGDQTTVFTVPIQTVTDTKKLSYGALFTFGKHEQDGNTENGKEDVEWIVVGFEDGKLLAVTRYALLTKTMSTAMWEGTTWEKCSLRKTLNAEFYGQTFSSEEKLLIAETQTGTDDRGKPLTDNVFLLSREEFEKYIEEEESFIFCPPTEYAKNQGAYLSDDGYVSWWLRSVYDKNNHMCIVRHTTGKIGGDYPFNGGCCVRPAIWLYCE